MRICIDFETTGLPRPGRPCGIVQIAAAKWDGEFFLPDEPLTFSTLINPELEDWEEGAINVHGIKPEDVADAPTFFQIFHDFADFVSGCDEWVGYNPEFDVEVLGIALDRYGFTTHFPWPMYRTDAMALANSHMNMQGRRGSKNPKLVEIYEHLFEKQLDGAHDAMVDVLATIEVLTALEEPHV